MRKTAAKITYSRFVYFPYARSLNKGCIHAVLVCLRLFFDVVVHAFSVCTRNFHAATDAAKTNIALTLFLAIASSYIGACGQTAVRPLNRIEQNDLPRPSRIVLHDFSFTTAKLVEYQGIFRQQPRNPNPMERQRGMAKDVSQAFTVELADRLRGLGFVVEHATSETILSEDALVIEGEFIRIDEGNALRRFVIGLGSGAANLQTRVCIYQGPQRTKLLEFTTEADSGNMPGAALTAPAGVATPTVVSAGIFTGNALATGFQNRADVAQLARSSAEQAARYVSEFFARQRWIRADQMKKARIAH